MDFIKSPTQTQTLPLLTNKVQFPSNFSSPSPQLRSWPRNSRVCVSKKMVELKKFWTKKTLVGLGLGQFLSLLITSTGFSSSELAKKGIDAPTSQSFLNYVLLALVYGSWMIYRRKALKAKWYYYVLLGLVDVEANFIVVKAYQYTSLTSVMLLDCWSIPSVMFLTWFFLKTKYRFRKFVGVAICVVGLVMVVFSDVHAGDRAGGSKPIKGDLLVILGSTLYAVTNVSEEFLVKNADRVELMGMLGLFGAIYFITNCSIIVSLTDFYILGHELCLEVSRKILNLYLLDYYLLPSLVKLLDSFNRSILERNELKNIHWSAGARLPFFGFAAAMFLFYSGVPILLKISGSTMLNLSLLTSDMWAVLIRIFAYHEKVDWMYYIAFAAVAVGLIIYSGAIGSYDGAEPASLFTTNGYTAASAELFM
ncbi:Solute carrier family 35 member SLC35F1/F2/F6 [Dillenia turbinata]|uniref:Solute carrier family 35 member SLC35F1/F2/F6 n=1 Tax=Dillenia turbinata TaxID=194707 RepID=A0AAN8YT86_9MAGN